MTEHSETSTFTTDTVTENTLTLNTITVNTTVIPHYYTHNRIIEPIVVIENWLFCHHLACVVKYIARAGRKGTVLPDLKKAEWYLEREILRYQNRVNRCEFMLTGGRTLPVEAVLADWELTENLERTISHIRAAKKCERGAPLQELNKALRSLRQEISRYENPE